MPLPEIQGETTEETVGALFDEWWTEVGSDAFVSFCRQKGLPILDQQDPETVIEQEKSKHDQFFENV